jgi:hypothetical protein
MAVLQSGSKCSHTTCMLRFFATSRLAMNPDLYFEIGSINEAPRSLNAEFPFHFRKLRGLMAKTKELSM